MVIKRSHWIKAGVVALVVHASVLIGMRSQPPGEASPPPGPKIEMATTMPGVIGSTEAALESSDAEAVEEIIEPDKTAVLDPEPVTDATAVMEPDQPELQDPELEDPELADIEPETQQVEPFAAEPETQRLKAEIPKNEIKQKANKKKAKLKKKKKKQTRKKKKRAKKLKRNKSKRSRSSKRGNKRKGKAGKKRSGGGKSRASAGSVNRYASRVRSRILSRRPGSGGRRGTAVISFKISKSGGLSWARISRSSGSGALDQKALSAVRRSSPFPRPPAGARGGQLRFSIPFRFR